MWLRELLFTSGGSLLLSDLLIGIAPRADLKAPANPAQRFRGVRRARRAAHGALLQTLNLIEHNRLLGFVQKFLIDHWGRQRLPFHPTVQ
jgi:hypothetical protein